MRVHMNPNQMNLPEGNAEQDSGCLISCEGGEQEYVTEKTETWRPTDQETDRAPD